MGQKGLTGAPDLVIEIISPPTSSGCPTGDTEMEIMPLQTDYEQIGTKEFWIIDQPRQQVRALFLDRIKNVFVPIKVDGNMLRSEVVTGFGLEINCLWRKPLPSVSDVLREIGV